MAKTLSIPFAHLTDPPKFNEYWGIEHRPERLDGRLVDYAGMGYNLNSDLDWRDNFIFTATLRFICFERGRSAAHGVFYWDGQGWNFPMFLTDMTELIERGLFRTGVAPTGEPLGGLVSGFWTFTKRGTNYAIRWVDPSPYSGDNRPQNFMQYPGSLPG